jgi:outer membrane protein assembly factor BamB
VEEQTSPPRDHINGWKDIAAHFGKATRTVQRWETQLRLPIHRIKTPSGEIVYAYRSELEAWRRSAEGTRGEAEPSEPDALSVDSDTRPRTGFLSTRLSQILAVSTFALVILMVAGVWWLASGTSPRQVVSSQAGTVANDPPLLELGPGLDPGPWPVVGHDSRSSNQSHLDGPSDPGEPDMVFSAPAPLGFNPTGNGDADFFIVKAPNQIVTGWVGEIVVLKPTGERIWSRPLTHLYAEIGPSGFAAAASGSIYVGTHSSVGPMVLRTFIQRFAPDGIGGWTRDQFGMTAPPSVGPDHTIYQTDEVCGLRAYSESGENTWTTVLAGYSMGATAFDHAGNLYVGTDGGAFNRTSVWSVAPNGRIRWTRETEGNFRSPAVSLDDRIYIASLEGTLLALDTGGKELWRKTRLPGTPWRLPLAVDATGHVYYRHSGGVMSFDRNGQPRWAFSLDSDTLISGTIVLDRQGFVYFASGDLVYSLTQDGQLRWTVPLRSPSRLLIGGEGLLYVVSEHQRIYSITNK